MKQYPLISVVVPVYNVAPYLRRCVDSLLAQTFTDFELILVDDGSTDGSGEICDEYVNFNENENENEDDNENDNENEDENEDENVRVNVLHQPNSGVSAARNHGIEAARGNYISFVDADDWVEPGFLQAFAETKTKTKYENEDENEDENEKVGALGQANRPLGDGRRGLPEQESRVKVSVKVDKWPDMLVQGFWNHEGKEMTWPEAHYNTAEELCSHLFEMEQRMLIGYVWNKLFRRDIIERYGVRFDPSVPIGEDMLFVMTFLSHATSLAVCPFAGYHYVFSGHKNYSFTAFNKRLDRFYNLLGEMRAMSVEVRNAFLFKEFRFSLYILHVLYQEHRSKTERFAYLRKIRSRVHPCKRCSIVSLESPYIWLALMVHCLPVVLSDYIFRSVIYRTPNE